MPILEEVSEATRVRVGASAPLELMWVLHNLQAKHVLSGPYASLEPLRNELQPKLTSFWADGVRGYTETIVLSERSGTTLDLDLDRVGPLTPEPDIGHHGGSAILVGP